MCTLLDHTVPVKKITHKEIDYVSESGLTSARTGSESGTSVSSFAKSSVRSKKTSVRGAGDSKPGTPGLGRLEDDSTVGLILELEDEEESITKFDESRKLFKMLQKAVVVILVLLYSNLHSTTYFLFSYLCLIEQIEISCKSLCCIGECWRRRICNS
jgi:hypothetical protein